MLNIETATLTEVKAFALANEIIVNGDKRVKENWVNAVKTWQLIASQSKVTLEEAEVITGAVDSLAEVVAIVAVDILTSTKAVTLYKELFHAFALTVVLSLLTTWKVGRWCWNHRSSTALAHWIAAFNASRSGHRSRAWLRLVKRDFKKGFGVFYCSPTQISP